MRKLIAVAVLALGLGYTATQVEDRMEARGVDEATAREAIRRATTVAERLAEEGQPSIRKHYVGLTCSVAAKSNCAAAIARALCGDADDAGFDAERDECREAEARTFDAERLCNATTGVHTQVAARIRLTDSQASRVAAAVSALPALRALADATDERWEAALSSRGLVRCVTDGGL